MCNPAMIPIAMVGNEVVKSVRNPKGGDGPTEAQKGQVKKYRKLRGKERTKYELKMSRTHPKGFSRSHFKSRVRDPHTGKVDYSKRYAIPLRPNLRRERERALKAGEDDRDLWNKEKHKSKFYTKDGKLSRNW